MNPEIINVNINKKINESSYPIFVGNNLLIQAGELLKKYINNKKLIVIHDDLDLEIGTMRIKVLTVILIDLFNQ